MKVLLSFIKSLVHTKHVGSGADYFFTNTHCARSVVERCDMDPSKVAVIQIDSEKAFDRVQHSVLYRVLEHVGVEQSILDGVQMAYSGCFTQLILNVHL